MAIEIRITKEIGNFKPKLLGPFTTRQVICLGIGVPVCMYIFQATSPYLPGDIPGFLCAIPGGIAWLFGWYEPYGMPTEKFIQSVFVNIFLAPTHRRYKTKNMHEEFLHKIESCDVGNESPRQPKSASGQATAKEKKQAKRNRVKQAKNALPVYYL